MPEVFDGFRAVLDTLMPGKYSVTTGNQEHKAGAPGAAGWDALGPGFTRIGEVAASGDFTIYHFGAAQEAMAFPDEDIDALSAYLDGVPKNIPVFVVSHYPLHLSVPYTGHDIPGGYRQTRNNRRLIEMLNRHPNVIFLWGHNHTFQLRGAKMSSPDIRAGIALLIAALSAKGTSVISNIEQIDRGYEDIEKRLTAIGAHITRLDPKKLPDNVPYLT